MNAPIDANIIPLIKQTIELPVVATIVSQKQDIDRRIEVGADILNVAASVKTPELVRAIRERYPDIPIIATGGPTDESIIKTIEAGANAITYTPPTNGEVFAQTMSRYRQRYE